MVTKHWVRLTSQVCEKGEGSLSPGESAFCLLHLRVLQTVALNSRGGKKMKTKTDPGPPMTNLQSPVPTPMNSSEKA